MESVLLSGLEQILYERVDLCGTESRLEILRHHVRLEAGRDLGVRVLDRLLDEGRPLARDLDLVQVRPDLAVGSGVCQRVAGATSALACEDRLALSSRRLLTAAGSLAATRRLRVDVCLDPLLVGLRRQNGGLDAHRGVAGAAELGADHLVVADAV